MAAESVIEKAVTLYAKSLGWLAFKWVSPSNRGVPDRIYFKDGEVVLIEFKAPGRKPTKLQSFIHTQLKRMGFIVHVVDDIDTGRALFDRRIPAKGSAT